MHSGSDELDGNTQGYKKKRTVTVSIAQTEGAHYRRPHQPLPREAKMEILVLILPLVALTTGLLSAQTVSFIQKGQFPVGTVPLAAGDLNGDKKLDLVVAESSGDVSLMLGNGDGTFRPAVTFATGQGIASIGVADLNNDGKLDVAVVDVNGVSVLLGNGDGSFQPVMHFAAGKGIYSAAVGDLNRDGKLDVVVSNSDGGVSVLLGNGNGTFRAAASFPAGTSPDAVAIGDFNKDGIPDLAVGDFGANFGTGTVSVLLGAGDGTFKPPVRYATASGNAADFVAIGDFNGDGNPDLVVNMDLLLGNGDGTFQTAVSLGSFEGQGSLDIADFNADGKLDIALLSPDSSNLTVLLGNGNGTFQPSLVFRVGSSSNIFVGSRTVIADFNGDGLPDLAIYNNQFSTVLINYMAPALLFKPVTPCRVADTRLANGPLGGPALGGQTSRDFAIPNSTCGIPSTATAYSLNVAVVPQGPLGFLTIWPTGQSPPLASTLNSLDGRIKSNGAIVPTGASGAISVFATNPTDVILDINGYFDLVSNTQAQAFYPVTPCRVADTRLRTGPLGGPRLASRETRSFPILSSSCGVPASAQAYSLNMTVVPPQPLGYLTAWPAGQPQPLVASLNALTGAITANAVIVPAGNNGNVNVFTTDPTDLVIDMNGYFAPPGPGGLSFHAVPPCRVKDTRLPAGTPPLSGTLDVNVTSSGCGIPASARAYSLGVAVVPSEPLGYLTLWPQGEARPVVATLNALDGEITSNMAIVPTNNGLISAFVTNPADLIIDINGYFAP